LNFTVEALMSLNIKNEEACQLAGLTGETMTGAITVALRERLAREKRRRNVDARVQELHAIGQRCAKLVGEGASSLEHGDLLTTSGACPSDRRFISGPRDSVR
jgi:antitoxin VapB